MEAQRSSSNAPQKLASEMGTTITAAQSVASTSRQKSVNNDLTRTYEVLVPRAHSQPNQNIAVKSDKIDSRVAASLDSTVFGGQLVGYQPISSNLREDSCRELVQNSTNKPRSTTNRADSKIQKGNYLAENSTALNQGSASGSNIDSKLTNCSSMYYFNEQNSNNSNAASSTSPVSHVKPSAINSAYHDGSLILNNNSTSLYLDAHRAGEQSILTTESSIKPTVNDDIKTPIGSNIQDQPKVMSHKTGKEITPQPDDTAKKDNAKKQCNTEHIHNPIGELKGSRVFGPPEDLDPDSNRIP